MDGAGSSVILDNDSGIGAKVNSAIESIRARILAQPKITEYSFGRDSFWFRLVDGDGSYTVSGVRCPDGSSIGWSIYDGDKRHTLMGTWNYDFERANENGKTICHPANIDPKAFNIPDYYIKKMNSGIATVLVTGGFLEIVKAASNYRMNGQR